MTITGKNEQNLFVDNVKVLTRINQACIDTPVVPNLNIYLQCMYVLKYSLLKYNGNKKYTTTLCLVTYCSEIMYDHYQ